MGLETMTSLTDVVVVGSGIAGLTAARRSQQLGLRVVVLDKGGEAPGRSNARMSQGYLGAAYLRMDTDAAELADYAREITSGRGRADLIEAWASNCARALEWVRAEGVDVEPVTDDVTQMYMLPYAPGTPGLAFFDRARGPDVAMTRYHDRFTARGGLWLGGTRATRLLTEDDGVIGVEADGPDGTVQVRASAVVIADGGFAADPELVRRHIGPAADRVKRRSLDTQTGDGIRMAERIGAATEGMEYFYGHLLSLDALENDELWPYPSMDGPARNGMLVGRDGRRLADEQASGTGLTRHYMSGIALANAVARTADPRSYSVVLDADGWAGSAWTQSPARFQGSYSANPAIAEHGGRVFEADDLRTLAELSGIDPVGLIATVEEFNAAVHEGRAHLLPVPRTAAARVIETPPFVAVSVVPGITYTLGGLSVTPDAQVRRVDGSPIPGLYAAGGSMGGLSGGPLGGYLGGLGEATVFGLLAAEHVARFGSELPLVS